MNISLKDIETALAENRFTLYFQPKISLVTGEVRGAEALARWIDDEGKIISPPGEFIPFAEEKGIISEITAQLVPKAIQTLKAVSEAGRPISIAINTSPDDFTNGRISSLIQENMHEMGLPIDRLQIEMTETAKLDDDDKARKHLYDIVDAGFKLTMDDFGTGYSSVDILSRLPFSAVKIDRGVITRMADSPKNLNIVNMITNMARTLRMYTIAEGIEDPHTYRFLSYAGCSEAQGFWMSHPLPEHDFLMFLENKPLWPCSQLGMIYHARMNNSYFQKSVLDAVLYSTCGINEEMTSVTSPDIEFRPEKTRLGQWYYGEGQVLYDRESFRAIEKPHKDMHDSGAELLKLASEGRQENFSQMVGWFNENCETVNRTLDCLQAELMAEEACQKWRLPS